ncbi:winged helix-turn-helix domain-containing protein [Methanolobus sp. WCC4]|uniref:helix-turn-helix transcriptional regulator n=1 Tax=Methanolobus sp. WCC4 TaxID=3125784 RepID=UPI0030FA25FE
MRSSLIDTLFLSEKRKGLLLFLKDGAKSSDEIKTAFDFPWKSMIPQIKKLVEWDLITYYKGTCTLTTMGKVIVRNMEDLLMTLEAHEKYRNYWLKHDLKPIPEELLYRIGELVNCDICEPQMPDIFEQQEDMLQRINGSEKIMAFVPVHHPAQLIIYSGLMEKGSVIDLIMTEDVYRIIRGEVPQNLNILLTDNPIFESLREEYEKEIENLFSDERSNIFVYKGQVRPLNLIVSDRFFSMALPGNFGKYDGTTISSSEGSAISWGKELFAHYKERSERIM